MTPTWMDIMDAKAKSRHRYEIILYWSHEDQAYIAEVPELPGRRLISA